MFKLIANEGQQTKKKKKKKGSTALQPRKVTFGVAKRSTAGPDIAREGRKQWIVVVNE